MIYHLRKFDKSEIAKERMKIINFYTQYGEKATQQAFGADRKVISRWKKQLKQSGGRLTALIPLSTRPRKVRQPATNSKIIDFIKEQREDHPRIGKDKIKPDLDEYCQKNNLVTVSISTIGNIIKRHHFFSQKEGRIYHNPASKWAQNQAKKKKRLRIKHSPKPTDYMSAIDAKMKFALTLNYRRITSANMRDFYQRFKSVYPETIKIWQSDNGSENLGEFDRELGKDQVPHLFIYPNCPQIDTFIERYNRTVQEEFIDYHLDTIHDKKLFSKKLADWNIYYNTKRRHHSLGLKSPVQHLIDNGGMSQKSLTYTRC